MKNITRALALLLALVLILGLVVTGFAEDSGTTGTGKITINNAVAGQTYTIYKILELESYNAEPGKEAYSYKVAQKWNTFVTTEATDFFEIHNNRTDNIVDGYVSWKGDKTEARAAEFAQKALAYAKKEVNGNPQIEPDDKITAESDTVVFNGTNGAGLPLGYYLVDSSMGTLCSLDTTNSEVTIREKNAVPTNDKQVQEDSKENEAGNGWGKTNDADFGQVVKFRSTITLPKGASNVKYHDTMDTNLELDKTTIKVYTDAALSVAVSTDEYTVTSDNTNGNLTDGCTFEVSFNQSYLNELAETNTTVYVSYSAKIKNDASIGTALVNNSHITYGDNNTQSEESKTNTYTWGFDVLKFANGQEGNVLSGVKFILLNSEKNKVATFSNDKFIEWKDFEEKTTKPNYTLPGNATLTTDDTGKINLSGLDSDTYHLREIEGLPGYNKLANDVEVKVEATVNENATSMSYQRKNIKVENKSGTEMPSTGGIGTTVFYVVGGILAVGAAVLLVTKKRMERG